ncbi:hematopoietic prostaglandin D synthase-like [Argopecten irradians]|uniref:hematopoietic prostaglandin D synthase-like n=1 Tax=Argopecten irradians TaxID=31199 RepID=UPI0037219146
MPPKGAPSKSRYSLTYFNVRARGELSRLLFTQAGIAFEDIRVEQADWPKLKPDTPNGTLPVLNVDGKKFGQSMAIARYLAAEFGLYGKTKLDNLAADEMLCEIVDLMTEVFKPIFEQDAAKKAELSKKLDETTIPGFLKRVEGKIGKSGYIVGDGITVADIGFLDVMSGIMGRGNTTCLDKFPKAKALMEKVKSQPKLKAYLAKRPDSQM